MWNKLKQKFDENPLETMLVVAAVVTAAAKLLDTYSAAQGRRAYAQQVQYSTRRK